MSISVNLSRSDLEDLARTLLSEKTTKKWHRRRLVQALSEASGVTDLIEVAEAAEDGPADSVPQLLLSPAAPKPTRHRRTQHRVAIVGCGEIAQSYVASLRRAGWEILSCFDEDRSKAEALDVTVAGSLQACFEGEPDLVLNLTPDFAHGAVTRAALEAGCSVWSEKPIAMCSSEARELQTLAAVGGLRLGCAPMSFWGEAQQSLQSFLPRLGQLHLVEVSVHVASSDPNERAQWREHPRFGRGSLRDCGIYALHLLVALLGPCDHLTCEAHGAKIGDEVDPAVDCFVATLRFNGVTCLFTCTQSLPSKRRGLRIYGENGSVELEEFWNFDTAIRATLDDGDVVVPYSYPPTSKHAPHPHVCDWSRGPQVLLECTNEEAVAMTAHTVHVLDILEAMEKSASSDGQSCFVGKKGAVLDRSLSVPLPRLPCVVPRRSVGSKEVSVLVLGLLGLPSSKPDAFAVLDAAWACGINAFDCAHVYGSAEQVLGAWLAKRKVPRDDVFLLGKAGHPRKDKRRLDEASIRSDIKESLQRLGVSQLDLLLLHRDDPDILDKPTDSAGLDGLIDRLESLQREGFFAAYGVSNWSPERLAALASSAERLGARVSANSPQVCLAEPVKSAWPDTQHWTLKTQEVHESHNLLGFGWAPLGQGYLLKADPSTEENANGDVAAKAGTGDYNSDENNSRRQRLTELAAELGTSNAACAVAYALATTDFVVIGTSQPQHLYDLVRGGSLREEVRPRATWLRNGEQSLP